MCCANTDLTHCVKDSFGLSMYPCAEMRANHEMLMDRIVVVL